MLKDQQTHGPWAQQSNSGQSRRDRRTQQGESKRQQLARYSEFRRMLGRDYSPDHALARAQALSLTAIPHPRVKAWIWIQVGRQYARQQDETDALLCAERAWRIAERHNLRPLMQAFRRRGRGMCGLPRPDQHPIPGGKGADGGDTGV